MLGHPLIIKSLLYWKINEAKNQISLLVKESTKSLIPEEPIKGNITKIFGNREVRTSIKRDQGFPKTSAMIAACFIM